MVKSVTSLLAGVAAQKGVIASLEEPAQKSANELAGSAYGGAPD